MLLTRTPAVAVLVALVGSLALSASAEAKPKPPKKLDTAIKKPQVFRYKFKPGEVDRYDTTMKQSIKLDSGGGPMPPMDSTSTIKAVLAMKTESVTPDGTATMVTSYEGLDLSIAQNGVKVGEQQLTPLEDMLKGTTSRSKLTSRGKPIDTQYEGQDNAMKQMSESMKSALVGTTPVFPEEGLKVGQSWKQNVPMNLSQGGMKLTINFNVTYTFLGFAKVADTRTAVFRTEVESSMNDTPSNLGGARIQMKGSGQGEGYLYFDKARGHLVKSELEMTQSTDMTVDSPQKQGSSSIKMSQTTAATMNLKK